MVGGYVIEVYESDDDVCVNCRSHGYYVPTDAGEERLVLDRDECAVRIAKCEASDAIDLGDDVWWMGNIAYWTPNGDRGKWTGKKDVPLTKIGPSFTRQCREVSTPDEV